MIAIHQKNSDHMETNPSFLRSAAMLVALSISCVAVQAQELVVSAAASLTNAFKAVGEAFEHSKPGAKVIFNFAGSGPLLAQIRQGAPVDVFASADEETMDRAATTALLDDATRVDFAQNTLVLIVPSGATQTPTQLNALTGASYARLSTGTPSTVPVGHYTVGAIEKAGLTTALQLKWIYAESVRQVLNYVSRGEVDAGFVYRTDALVERDKTRIALTVPTITPVRYPIAQIASSTNPTLAKDFIAFVRSAPGQEVLHRFGFSKP
jgi:molybdate transport system substrate-binding protein